MFYVLYILQRYIKWDSNFNVRVHRVVCSLQAAKTDTAAVSWRHFTRSRRSGWLFLEQQSSSSSEKVADAAVSARFNVHRPTFLFFVGGGSGPPNRAITGCSRRFSFSSSQLVVARSLSSPFLGQEIIVF